MANAPLDYASAGGQGVLDQPRLTRSDMVLIRKAVIGGYNLTPEQRQKVVARAAEILDAAPEEITDKEGNVVGVSYRDQLGAAKVLLAADKMDMDVERMAKEPAPENHLHLHSEASAMTTQEIRAELSRIIGAKGAGVIAGTGEPREGSKQPA